MTWNNLVVRLGVRVVLIGLAAILAMLILLSSVFAQNCQQMGNRTICSNGQIFTNMGNHTFDNRGQTWTRHGNTIFTPSNPYNPVPGQTMTGSQAVPLIQQPQQRRNQWPNTLYRSP